MGNVSGTDSLERPDAASIARARLTSLAGLASAASATAIGVVEEGDSTCKLCEVTFTLRNRKAHCRKCGCSVCHSCSPWKNGSDRYCVACAGIYDVPRRVTVMRRANSSSSAMAKSSSSISKFSITKLSEMNIPDILDEFHEEMGALSSHLGVKRPSEPSAQTIVENALDSWEERLNQLAMQECGKPERWDALTKIRLEMDEDSRVEKQLAELEEVQEQAGAALKQFAVYLAVLHQSDYLDMNRNQYRWHRQVTELKHKCDEFMDTEKAVLMSLPIKDLSPKQLYLRLFLELSALQIEEEMVHSEEKELDDIFEGMQLEITSDSDIKMMDDDSSTMEDKKKLERRTLLTLKMSVGKKESKLIKSMQVRKFLNYVADNLSDEPVPETLAILDSDLMLRKLVGLSDDRVRKLVLDVVSRLHAHLAGEQSEESEMDAVSDEDEIDEREVCKICFNNRKDHVFHPCGHCICGECFPSLEGRGKRRVCHICRTVSTDVIRLFHD